jgi:hypothetical protein
VGPFGVGGGGLVDGGDRLDEEVVPAETGVAFAAIRVEDPEGRPPPRRAVTVALDEGLRPLPHDVPPEPDPRAPREPEPEPGRLPDRGRQGGRDPGWFEDDEERLRATGERRQPAQPIGDLGGSVRRRQPTAGEVEEEQVHGPAGQQRAGDRQALVERGRGDHDEPFQTHAPGDRLDRIEGAREIQPRDDGAGRLRFRDQPKGERGPPAGAVATDGDARGSRQATGPQDRVEAGEPGVEDPIRGDVGDRCHVRRRRDRQRSDHLRSCRTPAGLEARQGGRHVRGEGGHPVIRIEQMFYLNQDPKRTFR